MIITTNSQTFRLFAFHKKFQKPSKQLIGLAFLLAAIPQISYAATTYIGDGVTTAVSSLSNGDSVNFSGNTGSPSEGTLNVDASRTLDSISVTNYSRGNINFTTASTLTVSSMGTLNLINFDADGTLELPDYFSIYNDLTASADNIGNLRLNGAGVSFNDIGSADNKIKSITVINPDLGITDKYYVFNGNTYTHSLVITENSNSAVNNYNYDLGHINVERGAFFYAGWRPTLIDLEISGAGTFGVAPYDQLFDAANIVTLTGNAIISSGMEFIFSNSNDTAVPGTMSKLLASGNNSITIADGITMNFYVTDSSKNIPLNTDYLIVDASAAGSSLNIDVSKINITTNSLLANFMLKEESNKLYVYNSEYNYNNLNKLAGSDSKLAQAALNNSSFSGTNMGTVRTQLLSISDMGQLKKAANSLNLTKNSTAQIGATQIGGKIANVISSRMSNFSAKNSGVSSGDSAIETGIWGQVFGGKAKQGELSNQESYNANTSGLIFGADSSFDWGRNLNSIIGASFAWGQTAINNVSSDRRTSIDSYQISLYNNNAKSDGLGFYNENQLSVSTNRYKTRRVISVGTFNAIATANFNGMQYGAKSGFGYNAKVSDKLLVTPNAAIEYYRISQEDYVESGAGNAGLSVQNKDFNLALSNVGVKFASNYQIGQKTLMPKLDLAWIHNLTNKGQSSTSSFIAGGNKVTASSNSLLKNTFNIGTELNLMSKDNSSVALRYDLQLGHEFTSQIVNLKYRMMF